jgi:glycosyltransferase involved in cell wall biosynthesis
MHLLIDALSVNNLSGRHVLLGHMRELVAGLGSSWRFTLLTHRDNVDLVTNVPDGVLHICAPIGGSVRARTLWLWRHGSGLCDAHAVDLVFSPAGMLSVGMPRPQIVIAQNPWPLLPSMARGAERIKAWLQRRAYARAQKMAALMVFNSRYMQDLYHDHFGPPLRSIVAYQGIDESLFAVAASMTGDGPRPPLILAVSVMARHKAIEVLVAAFALVAAQVLQARLVLAGGWPDAVYHDEISAQIAGLGLIDRVEDRGHVQHGDLLALYSEARVFCLPSRCESFGIPMVEAQAFATPAVVADGTAASEVADSGGVVVAQDDVATTARALQCLLTDDAIWSKMSAHARSNAERFHWHQCSAPLLAAMCELPREIATT